MNNIVLIGRITKDIDIKQLENGRKVSNITLAISRPYQNKDGIYETDFVDVTLWNGIAEQSSKYCQKGNLIGIKGRFETNIREDKAGNPIKVQNVVAEKVTFLAYKDKNKNQEER